MGKIKAYVILLGIFVVMCGIIASLETKVWNDGYCRYCNSKLEYVGKHYTGYRHDTEKYDYECANGHDFSFLIKY